MAFERDLPSISDEVQFCLALLLSANCKSTAISTATVREFLNGQVAATGLVLAVNDENRYGYGSRGGIPK